MLTSRITEGENRNWLCYHYGDQCLL